MGVHENSILQRKFQRIVTVGCCIYGEVLGTLKGKLESKKFGVILALPSVQYLISNA